MGAKKCAREPAVGKYTATYFDIAAMDITSAAFFYPPDVPAMTGSGAHLQVAHQFMRQASGNLFWAWSATSV